MRSEWFTYNNRYEGPIIKMGDAQDEERICRFCFEDETDRPDERLIAPCACKGGQKYVHLSCLRRWQRMVVVDQPTHPAMVEHKNDIRHLKCNVCQSEFTCAPPARHELMATFTGPEIAGLICKNRLIVAHPRFG